MTLFHYFKCDTFIIPAVDGGGKKSFLFKDYGVECSSSKYRTYSSFAICMIFIYPVGIPCMYISMLWGNRKTLSNTEKMNREIAAGYPTLGHVRFLVDAYKSEYFYFEAVECLRRLLLAAIIGIISENSGLAAIVAFVICIAFNFVFVKMKPFKDPDDSFLAIMLTYSLSLLFLAAIMLNVEIGAESGFNQQVFGVLLVIIILMGPIGIILYVSWKYVIPFVIDRIKLSRDGDMAKLLLRGVILDSAEADAAYDTSRAKISYEDSSLSSLEPHLYIEKLGRQSFESQLSRRSSEAVL